MSMLSRIKTWCSGRSRFEQPDRNPMGDDQFFATFYKGICGNSGIAMRVIAKLRHELEGALGTSLKEVAPWDNVFRLITEVDDVDIYHRLTRVFGVGKSLQSWETEVSGTFDSIVWWLLRHLNAISPEA